MKKVFKNCVLMAMMVFAITGCEKNSTEPNPDDQDNPTPGTNKAPNVKGTTTTTAGKEAEDVFIACYKKLTQVEQDVMEPFLSSLRETTKLKSASDDNSNEVATFTALIAGEGYSGNLIGASASAAVLMNENNPYALFNFGGYLRMTGKNNQAFSVLQQAATLAPKSAPILSALGCALYDKGDDAGAESRFNEALKNDPNCAFAAEGLAALYFKKGDKKKMVDNYCKTLSHFAPNRANNAVSSIEKTVASLIDDAIPLNGNSSTKAPPEVQQLMREGQYVPNRPSTPLLTSGVQEQYVGSQDVVHSAYHNGYIAGLGYHAADVIMAQYEFSLYYGENRGKQGKDEWVGFSREHIDISLNIINKYFNRAAKIYEEILDKLLDEMASEKFLNHQSYAETEGMFQNQLKTINTSYEAMDNLLDNYYTTQQLWMNKLLVEDDYKLYDHARRSIATVVMADVAAIVLFMQREDRDPILFLEGSPLKRGFRFPELTPYGGCNIETKKWEKTIYNGFEIATIVTTTISCDGVKTEFRFGDKNEKPPKDVKNNNNFKPFRRFYKMDGTLRSANANTAKVLYVSGQSVSGYFYNTASLGETLPDIVPGSTYKDMVGLFCGLEIK